jgi:DNA-binding transcriptional MerR regulator
MTVKQVAESSNVTVRTLHYYDQIGLLRPSAFSDAGYRLYDETALMRLQQILFYREIGFPLKEIRNILDDGHFDAAEALRAHRRELIERRTRMNLLICNIDRTLQAMEGGLPLSAKQLFDGFGKQMVEERAKIRRRDSQALRGRSGGQKQCHDRGHEPPGIRKPAERGRRDLQ